MVSTINMQDMRYLNLFEKITRVRTRFCFKYNEFIIFAVPEQLISKAIGEGGKNVKKLNEILNKKIKIVASPEGEEKEGVKDFIEAVVSPVKFKDLEIKEGEIIISAGKQSKAALIGRNKRRLLELQEIIKDFFKKDLRIV